LIRLATAHAKARLSPKVEGVDARQAEEIMRFALFREVPKRQRRKKRKLNNGAAVRKGSDGSDDDSESDDSDDEPAPAPAERMTSPPVVTTVAPVPLPKDPTWTDESQDVTMTVDEQPATASSGFTNNSNVRPDRFVACIDLF
jgi:DNA replication licensing factor MCM3